MDAWLLVPLAQKIGDVLLACCFIVFVLFSLWAFIRLTNPKKLSFGKGSADFSKSDDEESEPEPEGEQEEPPSLKQHRYFKLLEAAKSPAFFIPLTGEFSPKDSVNIAFLQCKFRVFQEGIGEFVEYLERTDGDGVGSFPSKINYLVEKCEVMSHKLVIELPDGTTIVGVPSCYLNKFNIWNSPHEKLCMDGVSNVLADRLYPDWWTRTAAALEYLYMAFELTREDALHTLSHLNGCLEAEVREKIAFAQGAGK